MRFAPFSCPERGSWIQGSQDKDFSLMLQESLLPAVCLHKYPRSQIEVNVMVLENSGSVLAHAITCASLALADAGIEMYDLVLGCSIRQDGASYVVDPSYEEQNGCSSVTENQGNLSVAFLPSLNQISGLQSDGDLTEETLAAGIRTCIEGCYKLYPVIQQALAKAVRKAAPPPSEGWETCYSIITHFIVILNDTIYFGDNDVFFLCLHCIVFKYNKQTLNMFLIILSIWLFLFYHDKKNRTHCNEMKRSHSL